MRPLVVALVPCVAFLSCSGKSSAENRTQQQLADLQKKKEAEAKAKRDKENAPVALPTEVVKLDAPYDDTQATVILPDGPCPDGFWALFGGDAPGATPEEKKANAAKRKDLADQVKKGKYIVKLRGPQQVTLGDYDAPKGLFPVDVIGTIDCTDGLGRIAIAWTAAKAGDPGNSAAKADADFAQNVWQADKTHFDLMIKSLTEAKEFDKLNKFQLSARVAFTPGKVEIDKKVRKVAKVKEKVAAANETLSFGGGNEDWGAGRLVHADLLGMRVATDREKKQLFEKGK
ncbi:MAG: hypothetical protein U0228_09985 [Myxococcaceae bacterium]